MVDDKSPTRAFIADATGILGRRVVAELVARGHHVVGLARSEANAELRRLGAEPRRGDLFDRKEMEKAAEGSDFVLHLATAIPVKARSSRADWAMNDRIRREGTRSLVAAAIANGAAPRQRGPRLDQRSFLEAAMIASTFSGA